MIDTQAAMASLKSGQLVSLGLDLYEEKQKQEQEQEQEGSLFFAATGNPMCQVLL